MIRPSEFRPLECKGNEDIIRREGHEADEYARRYDEVIVRTLLQAAPDALETAEEYVQSAWQHRQAEQFELAFADYARASELVPLAPEPHATAGFVHLELGQHDLDLEAYGRALERDPNNRSYISQRAHILREMGNPEQAVAELNEAIANDPRGGYFSSRGVAFEAMGMIDQALDDLQSAIEFDHDYAIQERCRVRAIHDPDPEAAIEECDSAMEFDSFRRFVALSWRGYAKFRQGRIEDAITDYDAVVADNARYTVTFRDVPEAISEGDTLDEARAAAADAVETALSFYIDGRKPLPAPSAPKRGEQIVHLSALGMAKTALYEAMRDEKVSRAELAKRLSCHLEQVARLLDLTHASKFEQLERALAAVDRKLIVTAEAA